MSAHVKRKTFAIVLIGVMAHLPCLGSTYGGKVPKTAQDYVTDFRNGKLFTSDADLDQLVKRLRFDKSALSVLAKELALGQPEVRENIVKLLEQIGVQLDDATPNKFKIIRDHRIIKILLVEGLARDDAAADASIAVLRKKCTPADLAAFSDIFISSLKRHEGDYLTLAAKAKVIPARPFVQELANSAEFKENEAAYETVKITLAALGDISVEDEFIRATFDAEKNAPPAPANRFYNVGDARDGSELAEKITVLGYIGTPRSLLVACSFLRSPLKSYVAQVRERSIRYTALDAIRYNFPDERVLHRPVTVKEWAAAEDFCIRNLGANFDGPTPSLPLDEAYPTRLTR